MEEVVTQVEETFSQMLLRRINELGKTDVEVYKKANLGRKLFSKIRSNPQYQPSWEFIFLGANMDAFSLAARVGIGRDRVANYHADSRGTQLNYAILSEVVSSLRANHSLDESWKEEIVRDYTDRVMD